MKAKNLKKLSTGPHSLPPANMNFLQTNDEVEQEQTDKIESDEKEKESANTSETSEVQNQ